MDCVRAAERADASFTPDDDYSPSRARRVILRCETARKARSASYSGGSCSSLAPQRTTLSVLRGAGLIPDFLSHEPPNAAEIASKEATKRCGQAQRSINVFSPSSQMTMFQPSRALCTAQVCVVCGGPKRIAGMEGALRVIIT